MVLETIVLLFTMVTCKEMYAIIIALHKKGFTGMGVAAKITPNHYNHILEFQGERFTGCEEGFRMPIGDLAAGECYHKSCFMPTVKHPEPIHVWDCL